MSFIVGIQTLVRHVLNLREPDTLYCNTETAELEMPLNLMPQDNYATHLMSLNFSSASGDGFLSG
jgi:hypothetical protein